MTDPWPFELDALSLTDTIRLQNKLSEMVAKRFERSLAVVFSDIAASTHYFARFGDEAGHRLQQQHIDLLTEAGTASDGHLVHTAGDGAMFSFPSVSHAVQALTRFHRSLRTLNCTLPPDQQWKTRTALHWGPVITDGKIFAGDTVNQCAKVCASARPGDIRMTASGYAELDSRLRSLCHVVRMEPLAGMVQPMALYSLCPQDLMDIPTHLRIEETQEHLELPEQPIVRLGRLLDVNGTRANDIVLQLADPQLTNQISRWHLELRRHPDGFLVHALSDKSTEVDGVHLKKGEHRAIRLNSTVRLSQVITLRFLNGASGETGEATTIVSRPRSLT